MSNKTVKCKVDYQENCDYKASTLTKEIEIPQQNVYIDIQKPQVININKRKGKNGNGQSYSTLTDTYYYNETLQITTCVYREIIDDQGNISYSSEPINIGKIKFEYINAQYPDAIPISLTKEIPIAENGLVTFNFIPHYDGYIKAYYICDDNNEGFYKNTETGIVGSNSTHREIRLTKIPVYVTPNIDNIFIEKEKEIRLICNVTDIYNNKLEYGYVTFMGYHDINPEALVNPTEGMGVMLGNPVELHNGIAELVYSPEQNLEVEYIHGSFNYNNDRYGNDFKYYYFHNNVIRVFPIKESNSLFLSGGKLINNNIDTTCDFDGFIHTEYNDTIRFNILFDDEEFTFYDDMDMIIHIDYTQYHLREAFTTRKITDVTEYINNNATFTTGNQEIRITKKGGNNTHKYGTPYDVNNWIPGYYSIYVSFKDAENKQNSDRQYYTDFKTDKIYIAVDYPNTSLSLDDIECTDGKFTIQPNTNFANYLKVKCNDDVPTNLTGHFIINDKEYVAKLNKNNEFVMPTSSSITIKNIGNYSVAFSTDYYYDPDNHKIYVSQFSSMPTDNPVLKVRDNLKAVINIPKEYVSNEYPGSIQYQISVKNYYDGEYILKTSLYKDNVKYKNLGNFEYNGQDIINIVDNLPIGRYYIKVELYKDDTINIAKSAVREITPTELKGFIAPPFDSNEEEIITGFSTTIPYIIEPKKGKIINYDNTNLKIWFRHENEDNYTGYPINNLNIANNAVYIDYIKDFFKTGIWYTYINQNVDDDVMIVKPNDNNLGAMDIDLHHFTAKTISPIINIEKNLINESLDIHINNENNLSNQQVLLLKVEISYALGEIAQVYVLTDQDNRISIPFSECNNDLNSPILQRQIYNIKVTVDPFDNTLINSIKNKTDQEAKNIINNYFDTFYTSENNLNKFINQIKEMDYYCLFATYKKAIKSENYGPQ